MIGTKKDGRNDGVVAAVFCVVLALASSSVVATAGYLLVVGYFGQEEVTFWVALSIAVLIWFIEEMLHLTIPCRRALRRLAHRMAELWLARRETH